MKRALETLGIWMSLAILAAGTGCSTAAQRRIPTVSLAVVPVSGLAPSADQMSRIREALKPQLAQAGFAYADNWGAADFVVTVRFVAAPQGQGGHATVVGVEPTQRFRDAADGSETPEAKEWRRRLGEIEQWVQRQARNTDS